MKVTEIFRGRVVTLNLEEIPLPNGHVAKLEVARHLPAAAIVPMTADKGQILLIRQFRPVIGAWAWEIPAGLIDPGETPLECAQRELEEETGWVAENVEPLAAIHTSIGFTDEVIHIFKGTGLTPSLKRQEATEVIEEKFLPPDQVLKMIADREITDSKTLIGLFYALRA
jgi:ADP-ribose diphosphatase